jgi:hypothetical protein
VTSVPAKMYLPGTPMHSMAPGGYQTRIDPKGNIVWFFRLPLGGAVIQKADALVPTFDGCPEVKIAGWTLAGNVWRKP